MKKRMKINVCICTYLRAAHLEKCLVSLINQTTPKDFSYSITVIDNDRNQSAESIVRNLEAQSEVPIQYICEQQRGIPFARNKALEESLKLNFDYIAFIDDDEQAPCNWLNTLYTYLCSFTECVVIHGRVKKQFPEGTSRHIRDCYCTKKERTTGSQLNTCATNNVIFSTDILRRYNLRFDTSAPYAGGTDTKFFFEVNIRGVPIYECAEAFVYETIFQSRLKMCWILRRKYRSGITTAWLRMKEGKTKLGLILKSISKVFPYTIYCCFNTVCFRSTKRNRSLLKIVKYAGILAGCLGIKIDSYYRIDS